MSLTQRLSQAAGVRQTALPSLKALESGTRKVLHRWPHVVPRVEERDREAVVQCMLRRIQADDWDGCRLSEIVRAAGVVFDSDFRDRADLLSLRRFLPVRDARLHAR